MVYEMLENYQINNNNLLSNLKITAIFIIYYLYTNSIDLVCLSILLIKNDNNLYKSNDILYNLLTYFYIINCILELYFAYVKIISQTVNTFYYRFNICYYIFYLNFILFSDIFKFTNNIFSLTQIIVFYFLKVGIVILNIQLTQYLYQNNNSKNLGEVEREYYLVI